MQKLADISLFESIGVNTSSNNIWRNYQDNTVVSVFNDFHAFFKALSKHQPKLMKDTLKLIPEHQLQDLMSFYLTKLGDDYVDIRDSFDSAKKNLTEFPIITKGLRAVYDRLKKKLPLKGSIGFLTPPIQKKGIQYLQQLLSGMATQYRTTLSSKSVAESYDGGTSNSSKSLGGTNSFKEKSKQDLDQSIYRLYKRDWKGVSKFDIRHAPITTTLNNTMKHIFKTVGEQATNDNVAVQWNPAIYNSYIRQLNQLLHGIEQGYENFRKILTGRLYSEA